jgi:hypothetical protein
VTGDRSDNEPAWHERTSTVVGASAAALAVIGLLWLLISYVVGGSDDPGYPSQYYPEPSGSGSITAFTTTGTTSSTEVITSTSPPVTTDIDPGNTTTTSSTSDTSTTSTTPFDPSNLPHTRTSNSNDGGGTSTRQRPRLNETRTLYPQP